jgi:hypothetical protein
MSLKQCSLEKVAQSEGGSGVTNSNNVYDENLYLSIKAF